MEPKTGLTWNEVFALVSIIFTIVGAFWAFSRIVKRDLKENVVDLHLVPMKTRLGEINGRVGKVEVEMGKVDRAVTDHIKSDDKNFADVRGYVSAVHKNLDTDVREIRGRVDALSRIHGSRS